MGRTSQAKIHLIETALELMWADSYHAVGVKEICEKAGVKPGSFYYFFPAKRDLALAAMEFHWLQAKENVLEPSFSPALSPQKRIATLFERTYAFHAARQKNGKPVNGCVFGSFAGELGEEEHAIKSCVESMLSRIAGYFEKAVSDAVEMGTLSVKKEKIPEIAQALLSYYQGLAILARVQNNAEVFRNLGPYAQKIMT